MIVFDTRAFSVGDFDRLRQLFSKEFKPDDRLLSVSYTSWLYAENPYGTAKIVTASQDGVWVAFMAMIPTVLIRKGKIASAYYVVNVLVDQAHRGKKLFQQMISEAEQLCKNEGALLMGHPNPAAHGTWLRAGMQFHQPLRAHFLRPRLPCFGHYMSDDVSETLQLERFLECYNAVTRTASSLRVLLTKDYLRWRYLGHPTTKYRLQLISRDAQPTGLIVTKRLRCRLHMMVEHFFVQECSLQCFGWAPWLTVAFVRDEFAENIPKLSPRLIRKEIPFFCNDYRTVLEDSDVAQLGLSISDF
jgi:GNAT superfamily N-acetyltransferase